MLVRHGESEQNRERSLVDSGKRHDFSKRIKETRNADIRLTPNGRFQAKKTGELLKKEYRKFDAVFASPFRRARETAAGILKTFGANVPHTIIEERIREKEFGIFHATTAEEIRKKYPEWHHLRGIEGKYYFRPPGGESYPDIALRVHDFLGTLVREHSGKNILVVSHSAIMLVFHKLLTRMTEEEILQLDSENRIKNCGIISYVLDPKLGKEGRLTAKYFNRVAYSNLS